MQTCDDEENFLAEVQTPTDGLAILENMFQLLICCVLYGKAEWQEVQSKGERMSGNVNYYSALDNSSLNFCFFLVF